MAPQPEDLEGRPLAGRRALVTGASRRLGLALAQRFAQAGADVVLHAHRGLEAARTAARALARGGTRAVALGADLRDEAQCAQLVAQADEALGGLDLLVHNAALFTRTPLATLTAGDFDRHMALNARPLVTLCTEAGRRMSAGNGGAIVNVACTSGLKAWKGYLAYSASKAAVISLTQGFALALAPKVRVNAVAPGPVLPPPDWDRGAVERVAETTLLKRWGAPSDLTEAVLFLATAPWLTGVVLPVDGGRSVR